MITDRFTGQNVRLMEVHKTSNDGTTTQGNQLRFTLNSDLIN